MVDINTIIFDLDGCLVDSEPYTLEALASEFRKLGASDITASYIGDRFLGIGLQVICDHVKDTTGIQCPADFSSRVENHLFEQYRQKQLPTIDGVFALLDQLQRSSIKTGIATGGSIRRMNETLAVSALANYFVGTAFSADEVKFGKPAPDLFLYAADKMQVLPQHCLVLEDSPHGVEGAVRAGMKAVGFVGGSHLNDKRESHSDLLREAGASCVVSDLSQLPMQLARIIQQ